MTDPDSGNDAATVREAIDRYHGLLRGDLGPKTVRALQEALESSDLVFGDRPICRVLRPFFLARAEADRLLSEVTILVRAYRKVYRALNTRKELRDLLNLSAAEEAMVAADRQQIEPDAIARMDGFLVRGGAFKVIEYNAESPGGIAFGDTLASIFRKLPVFEEFSKTCPLTTHDGLGMTLGQLLAAHRARVGDVAPSARPTIAVVDWKAAPTRREFEICAETFTRHGYPSRVIEPSELRIENGRLIAGDFVIDIVYKRALVKDLMEHGGANHALAKAVASGIVTCASGFGVLLLYRKELFAMLHDERIAKDFDADERGAIARTVPWTRLVEDSTIERDGARTRLVEFIRKNRERLVIKPTNEYGGTGVVLGWLVDPARWDDAIRTALGGNHIVQERVELPNELFPVAHEGRVVFERFYADINPFVWGGKQAIGFGARLAAGELLNVTAGGGSALPVFVIER